MDSSLSLRPAIQLAGLILGGLFFLNQTRKQGLVLSLLCMVAWLGTVFLALNVIRQQRAQVGGSVSISKRVETIDEVSLIQLDPIIQTETEQVIVVLPNEETQVQAEIRSGSWVIFSEGGGFNPAPVCVLVAAAAGDPSRRRAAPHGG